MGKIIWDYTTVRKFLQGIRFQNREKMEPMLLAYGLFKQTAKAIMTLYKNTRAIFRSPYGDTIVLEIFAGVLERDSFVSYLFICQTNVLWTSIDLITH